MPLGRDEVSKLAEEHWKIEPYEVDGPFRFGGLYTWEVWMDTSDEEDEEYWEVKFIMEETSRSLYFDNVAALMVHLNDAYQAATLQAGAMDWTRTKELAELERKKLTLYVASAVFGMTVLMMLAIVTVDQLVAISRGRQSSDNHVIILIVTTILGIIFERRSAFLRTMDSDWEEKSE